MKTKNEQLKTLAILHYVAGGIGCLFSCFPLIHVGIGLFLLNAPAEQTAQANGNPPPEFVAYLFAALGFLFFLLGQTLSALMIYSGRCIAQEIKYRFSFVVGCISCAFFPMGTALGVYAIITLQKEEIKRLYGLES